MKKLFTEFHLKIILQSLKESFSFSYHCLVAFLKALQAVLLKASKPFADTTWQAFVE